MRDPNEPFENLRPLDLLAIAAHPDDVEQTCGGTLIRMTELGYRSGVLDLTAGDMGSRGTRPICGLRNQKRRRSICCWPGGRICAGRMRGWKIPRRLA